LRLALWYVLPFLCEIILILSSSIGSLLICRNYIQYPAALRGPFLSTSINTNTHFHDPIRVITHRRRGAGFLERPCVSLWAGRSICLMSPSSRIMMQGHPLRKSSARSLHVVACAFLPLPPKMPLAHKVL
jgi:hypothetical protein